MYQKTIVKCKLNSSSKARRLGSNPGTEAYEPGTLTIRLRSLQEFWIFYIIYSLKMVKHFRLIELVDDGVAIEATVAASI